MIHHFWLSKKSAISLPPSLPYVLSNKNVLNLKVNIYIMNNRCISLNSISGITLVLRGADYPTFVQQNFLQLILGVFRGVSRYGLGKIKPLG